MNIQSFGSIAILLALLLALPVKAETPFVIESAWFVGNNEWLANADITLTGNIEGSSLKFPEELPADVTWAGATITDGDTIKTVIALHNPQGNFDELAGFQGFMFRVNLRNNAVVAAAFPNGFQMLQYKDRDKSTEWLILHSSGLSAADIDALGMKSLWNDLRTKSHFGFIQYFPERTLLPTLPPEQEDESEFVKKIRERSADNYKDGQYIGTVDSWFLGFHVIGEEDFRIVVEWQNVEGTPVSNFIETVPFPFGGFVDSESSFGSALRIPIGKEIIEKAFFTIHAGSSVIPPDEREDERKHFFYGSFKFNTKKLKENDDYHWITEEHFSLGYPKQAENRPEEEGVPSNTELDKINEELVRATLPFFSNVRQTLMLLDWSQTIGLAMSKEDDVFYLACTYPIADIPIDWNLVEQLRQALDNHGRQLKLPNDSLSDSLLRIEALDAFGTVAGLPVYEASLTWGGEEFVIAYSQEPGIIYAAILHVNDGEEIAEEQYATMQRRLEQKIEISRKGATENREPTTTVFHSSFEGTRLRVDYETTEREHRFTAHIGRDSFGNVLGLAQMFGVNPSQMLPFLHGQ